MTMQPPTSIIQYSFSWGGEALLNMDPELVPVAVQWLPEFSSLSFTKCTAWLTEVRLRSRGRKDILEMRSGSEITW